MKVYFLAAYSPEINIDEGSLVIALTPLVCYQLDKAGISYSIVEDFYDEAEMISNEDEYNREQMKWIGELDTFIKDNVKEVRQLNLNYGFIYYSYLKTTLLDPLYIRCYTMSRLFSAVSPAAVTFVTHPSPEAPLDFTLSNTGRTYASVITEALCRERGIQWHSVYLPGGKEAVENAARHGTFLARMKWMLGGNSLVRCIYFLPRRLLFRYRCLRNSLFDGRTSRTGFNLLLLKISHIGENFIIGALKKGHRVYELSGNTVIKYSRLGVRRRHTLGVKGDRVNVPDRDAWDNAAKNLDGHELVSRVNQACGLDVSGTVLPRLQYFISAVCPEIYRYIRGFMHLYDNEGIDFVITPHEVLPAEFGAIAAAKQRPKTRSVCIQHGEGTFKVKFWNISELAHFDYYISSQKEIGGYFIGQCQADGIPTRVHFSPHRLSNMIRIRSLRAGDKTNIKKNRIIYLPTIFVGDKRRLDGQTLPDAWYYKFQKALIEYFSTRKEYTFVWKGLLTSDAVYNPIPDFIEDNHYDNIKIATNPFPQHLLSTERVICDYPSTGFYEAVTAGVPIFSLYHRALKIRETARDLFGKLLVPFTDVSEAIGHIEKFLASDPDSYTMNIDMEGKGVLDLLEEIGTNDTG